MRALAVHLMVRIEGDAVGDSERERLTRVHHFERRHVGVDHIGE
jgi:hypothetical protein